MKKLLLCLATAFGVYAQHAYAQQAVQLSLKRAVDLAISPEGNTKVQLAQESLLQARLRSLQARAALLPNIEGQVSEQNLNRNVEAFGLHFDIPIPGVRFPTVVGPFDVFDARVSGAQSIFDFASIKRYQASKTAVKASESDVTGSQDQTAATVAKAYLAALKADADLEAARANVELSQALLKQAENQKQAGTGTGIEITRARVQLANDQQRRLNADNERRRAVLQLLRAIGLRLDADVQLTGKLEYTPADNVTMESAREQAMKSRADWKAQQERESNARLSSTAVRYERLPSVSTFGDYGSSGTAITNSVPTRSYGIAVKVPIFDGGRRDARRAEAASQSRQEHIRTADLKEQIDLEIRLALDSLHSADEQVKVAREGLTLSENELAQARRRYDAGVAPGIEVTDAQTRLARSRDNQTAALLLYNQARIDLAQATGTIRSFIQ